MSLDGPRELHDAHRKDKGGHGTFDRVLAAARLLQAHKVELNILCTVNATNSRQPLDSYRFERLRETAFDYAFILWQLGVEKVEP